jgi:hypothetical protein
VLARIGAHTTTGCEGLTPIKSGPRPNGASCTDGTDCASGLCTNGDAPDGNWFGLVCAGCDATHTCANAGEVCGLGDALQPILSVPVLCVPAAARDLGERCLGDGECASAQCIQGVCSACGGMGPACPTGERCDASWTNRTFTSLFVCGAGAHKAKPGEPCGLNADCASDGCMGTPRSECSDGRPCNDAGDCPVVSGLDPGHCTMVGIQGGSCE